MHHLVGELYSVLLAFLVPAPLIDLGFSQASAFRHLEENFLRPVFVLVEGVDEVAKLVIVLSLALLDDTLILTRLRVVLKLLSLILPNHDVVRVRTLLFKLLLRII